jgi:hypothetical protein
MSRWIDRLDDEDVAFLKRLVLASGSLKELAEAYGVSYPTIRLRLDRLIAKVEVFDSTKPMSEFERLARGMVAAGTLDPSALKSLLTAHTKSLEARHASATDNDDARADRGADRGNGKPSNARR